MSLRISTPTHPADPTFARVLSSIPEGTQWSRGNVIPYRELDGVQLLLTADVGVPATLYLAGREVLLIVPETPTTTIRLPLVRGFNKIVVKQGMSTYQTMLVATEYAIYLRAFSDETYANLERDIEVFEQHFRSFFSVRITEHQTLFADMWPGSQAYRTLLAKIAIRALINESYSTRGVEDIVTSVTVSNPYVVSQVASYDPNDPIYFSDAQDFGGNTFHVWLPNSCLASWYGFSTLVDTVGGDTTKLVSATDARIVVNHEGQEISSIFNTLDPSCVDLEDPCEDDYHIWVKLRSFLYVWLCYWSQPFDSGIDIPLGRKRLDTGLVFDSGIPLDSMDETAPLDGWFGTVVSMRFDAPACLDSTVGGASSEYEEDLCCTASAGLLLVENLVEFRSDALPDGYASMTVLPA